MANMSYCRFQNTEIDLRDCLNALSDEERISDDEVKCAKRMFTNFLDFCAEFGIIEEYDEGAINEVFEVGGAGDDY